MGLLCMRLIFPGASFKDNTQYKEPMNIPKETGGSVSWCVLCTVIEYQWNVMYGDLNCIYLVISF